MTTTTKKASVKKATKTKNPAAKKTATTKTSTAKKTATAKATTAKKTATAKATTTKATTAKKTSVNPVPKNQAPEKTVPVKRVYVRNKDLLRATIESKKGDRMSDELGNMLIMLCSRYGKKGNWANYTYNDDMQAYAMMMLVRTWRSFNEERGTNAFAFFTQCIKNSFKQFLNAEKKQRNVRDELLIKQGLDPSFTYLNEHTKFGPSDEEN